MLTEVTLHKDEARALLLEQFRGTVNFQLLLDSYIAQIQALEAVTYDLLTERELDTAIGTQLDNLGLIVGQKREGRSDADYRITLRARVRINTGSGTPEDINAVMSAILLMSVVLEEQPAAAFVVRPSGALAVGVGPVAAKILKSIKPAGVRSVFEYSETAYASTFTLGDLTMPLDTNVGLGDLAQTTGGRMATASEG